MPIYEFECSKCNKRFEKIISISNSDQITCDCSPNAVAKKVVSAPSFRLSGKGWYETDFKTGSKKNLVQSDKSEKKSPKPNSTKEK